IEHAAKASRLNGLRVTSGTPFTGDGPLLTTVSPNGDGLRDQAVVHFRLVSPGTVSLQVTVCRKHPIRVSTTEASLVRADISSYGPLRRPRSPRPTGCS